MTSCDASLRAVRSKSFAASASALRLAHVARAVAAVALISGQLGCTVLRIQQRDGAVETRWRFGVVSVELAPGTEGIAAESRSFGMANGPMGFAFGYQDSTVVGIPADCRLIVWVASDEELAHLEELIETDAVCASVLPR